MAKVREILKSDGVTHHGWIWFCPGCNHYHECDERWTFNGNKDAPTFGAHPGQTCSVLVISSWKGVETRCHSHVTDGRIAYAPDSTHSLTGQTVDMRDEE